jgi:hypothetical protein
MLAVLPFVPMRAGLTADQPQVSLMDQRGSLERLARFLAGQPVCGELSQLVVDERQELLRGLGVALLDGAQDAGDVAHGLQDSRQREALPLNGPDREDREASDHGLARDFSSSLSWA